MCLNDLKELSVHQYSGNNQEVYHLPKNEAHYDGFFFVRHAIENPGHGDYKHQNP